MSRYNCETLRYHCVQQQAKPVLQFIPDRKQLMKKPFALLSLVATLLSVGSVVAQTHTVGSFTVEVVERKVSAGGFPNTSSNPFERRPITEFRVFHQGKQVVPPGTEPDRGAPWWDVRLLVGAPRPALLLMEMGAVLVTDEGGQLRLQELAPRDGNHCRWQWLDGNQGQPGAVELVGIGHRPDQALELTGGRWLSIYEQFILDVKTLALYPYQVTSSEVLGQLQHFYPANKPALMLSPGGTTFVVTGSRDRPGEDDMAKRFEYALVMFDFVNRIGTVLPINFNRWRVPTPQDIDAAFAKRVLGWRRDPDGREHAFLRTDLPTQYWTGRLRGREMRSLSYDLQPVTPAMGDALARFIEAQFDAQISPERIEGKLAVRIGDLTLSLGFPGSRAPRVILYPSSDQWQREAEAHVWIERIGERFNERLLAGEYQEHFLVEP
jgi:hypothetical protein